MIYADYAYYTSEFGGDVFEAENDFNKFATKASRYIDRLTMNRAEGYAILKPDDTALKNACCAGADQYFMIVNSRKNAETAITEDGEIASEHVGSHSVTYRSGLETAEQLEAELRQIVSSYLAMTGLLYRGTNYVHASHCYTDIG